MWKSVNQYVDQKKDDHRAYKECDVISLKHLFSTPLNTLHFYCTSADSDCQ